MADDHDEPNELNDNDNDDANDLLDYDDVSTAPSVSPNTTRSSLLDEYDDDEPIEDYVVNMVVNERPDMVGTFVTDSYGNTVSDSLNALATSVYDELNGNGTALTGGKRWFGWSTTKLIFAILLALCLLGIILAAVFFVLSKKFKKNQRSTGTAASTATTKAVVTKGNSPDPKYQPVPNV